MAKLVETCTKAIFYCSSALCQEEFLTIIATVERRHLFQASSGMRELYNTFTLVKERAGEVIHTLVNRVIYNKNNCQIWTLSPSDADFSLFLQNVARLLPSNNETKRRIRPLTPNNAAVVLLVTFNETAVLLGSDLDRKGWLRILDSSVRPRRKASVFKVPHHGSQNAHEDRIWEELLNNTPIALLTPWRRGSGALPTREDVLRILGLADQAYITTTNSRNLFSKSRRVRDSAVGKTIDNAKATLRSVNLSLGKIRLRRHKESQDEWDIETFGNACDLRDYIV